MIKYITLALTCILVGCLNTGEEAVASDNASTFFTTLGAAGVPFTGLAGAGFGILAEFIRGRKGKKDLVAQAGAIHRSVDEHLNSLSEADKLQAKKLISEALVKTLGEEKAAKAKTALKVGKELSSKLHK